tara:strand:+ start:792 stop:941 length:150 start_codon:yes stop_codon:yes gene_type:complete
MKYYFITNRHTGVSISGSIQHKQPKKVLRALYCKENFIVLTMNTKPFKF